MTDPIRAGGKNPFEYQKLTEDQIKRIEAVRCACRVLNKTLALYCPSSRERSLAITKLEEVSMWANKSIVFEE